MSGESPSIVQKPVVEHRVIMMQVAQYEYQNPYNCRALFEDKRRPWPGEHFKQRKGSHIPILHTGNQNPLHQGKSNHFFFPFLQGKCIATSGWEEKKRLHGE